MFDNIGGKIKGLAKFICWIGIIGSIIGAISMIVQGSNMYRGGETYIISGIVVGVLGCVLSWAGSFVLYGFGELITTQQEINSKLSRNSSAPVRSSNSKAASNSIFKDDELPRL